MFYPLIRPLLFSIDPERSHDFVVSAGQVIQNIPAIRNSLTRLYSLKAPELVTEVMGLRFDNPVGIAAGFDKNAKLLPLLATLGFGFVEVGSVTHLPSIGNAKPRLFRLPIDQGLINRMGLNNDGPEIITRRVANSSLPTPMVIGINIAKTNDPQILGKNAVRDMVSCYKQVAPASSFIVINVSCPNTADGKTFESGPGLEELLCSLKEERDKFPRAIPTLVKFSPDISQKELELAIASCERYAIDGYVLVNTSKSRESLRSAEKLLTDIGAGGLSGQPLTARAVERVATVYRLLGGKKPIIGVGGIDCAETAYRFICAGASLVEVYTGLVYRGPGLGRTINSGLVKLLRRDGFTHVAQAVGTKL